MKKFVLLLISCLSGIVVAFGQGTIRGKISDKNGETLIGVTVVLKSNRSIGAATDLDGNYSLKITDSSAQTIVVSYISFQTIEQEVHPLNNEVIIKDFVLEEMSQALGEVEVLAKSTKANTYYMENIKKNSSTTLDYISSETMKKTGDATVVAAVARVSGVSTNSGFITVRGIGDRYVKTTMNGSRIPTLDPYTNNIKLDMFPASLIDNVVITKTASPDLPGDWAGAYISVETKDYPDRLAVNVETSVEYNNQSTFKDVITSDRSSTDWLGYDSGLRNYNHNDFVQLNQDPSMYDQYVAYKPELADYYASMGVDKNSAWNETYTKLGLVELGLLDKVKFDDPAAIAAAKNDYQYGNYSQQAYAKINAEAAKSGQALPNNWDVKYRKAPLNFTQNFSIGNQINLFGRPLGILAGFRYSNATFYDPNATSNRVSQSSTGETFYTYQATEQNSREMNGWSALANIAYKINPNNSFSLMFMPNVNGVNNVRYTTDTAEVPTTGSLNINKSQMYEERKQMIYQYKSEHFIPKQKIKLEFNASYTDGESSVPDFKKLAYTKDNSSEVYQIGGERGINRSYRYLSENVLDTRFDAEMPLKEKAGFTRKIKVGGSYLNNTRDSRQFDYAVRFGPYADGSLVGGDIQSFFDTDKFGVYQDSTKDGIPYSSVDLYYYRTDSPANHTIGYSKVLAGFAMLDYTIIPAIRAAGGLRIEQSSIFSDAYLFKQQGLASDDGRRHYPGGSFDLHPANFNELSYLPSANLILKLNKSEVAPFNLRLNFSQTVARPSIRELTDVVIYDYELRANVYGNSDLKIVKIKNYDMRLESYFKNGDNVSTSLFYKDFKDHIEVSGGAGGYSWTNAEKSTVMGIELEGKKVLTRSFDIQANATFIKSNTTFIQKNLRITNGVKEYIEAGEVSRSMYGQAPYVLNGIITYKADSIGMNITASYNVQGPRLVITSMTKEFGVYEMPRHALDLKISKTLGKYFSTSFTVRNISNAPLRRAYKYDDYKIDYDRYTYGVNYKLSIVFKI